MFKGEHNHTITTAEAMSCLRPRDDTRSLYESYFNDGMGIRDSVSFHESKLELLYGIDSPELANSRLNPKYRTVQHWFNQWRSVNLGPRFGPGSIEVFTIIFVYCFCVECMIIVAEAGRKTWAV